MLRVLYVLALTASGPVTMFTWLRGFQVMWEANWVAGVVASIATTLTFLSIGLLFDSRQPPPHQPRHGQGFGPDFR